MCASSIVTACACDRKYGRSPLTSLPRCLHSSLSLRFLWPYLFRAYFSKHEEGLSLSTQTRVCLFKVTEDTLTKSTSSRVRRVAAYRVFVNTLTWLNLSVTKLISIERGRAFQKVTWWKRGGVNECVHVKERQTEWEDLHLQQLKCYE